MLQFIHIPKTGGTSIEFAYKKYGWGRLHKYDHKYLIWPWHDEKLLQEVFVNDICFCIIRVPLDRLLSEYRFRKYPDDPDIMNKVLLNEWSKPIQNNIRIKDNHLYPQYYFAKYCRHLLLYECFKEDLEKLLKEYNMDIIPLQHFNKTYNLYNNINTSLISKENLEWIYKYYKNDFLLYNSLLYDKSFI